MLPPRVSPALESSHSPGLSTATHTLPPAPAQGSQPRAAHESVDTGLAGHMNYYFKNSPLPSSDWGLMFYRCFFQRLFFWFLRLGCPFAPRSTLGQVQTAFQDSLHPQPPSRARLASWGTRKGGVGSSRPGGGDRDLGGGIHRGCKASGQHGLGGDSFSPWGPEPVTRVRTFVPPPPGGPAGTWSSRSCSLHSPTCPSPLCGVAAQGREASSGGGG